jgi:hypothetical protein
MERRYGSLFVKTFHYLVGYTSSDTILHLTGLQDSPIDKFGYVQHSLKKDFKFPNNLVMKKTQNGRLYVQPQKSRAWTPANHAPLWWMEKHVTGQENWPWQKI